MECVNAEQYFTLLNSIEEKLQLMDVKTANEMLDELFVIKPVRLKWYLLKAQTMLVESRDIDEIIQFLSNKCEPWYPYDDVEEYLAFLGILNEMKGDVVESKRYFYQLNRLQEAFQETEGGNRIVEDELKNIACKVADIESMRLQDVNKLTELYYISGNLYLYLLWQIVVNQLFPEERRELRKSILSKQNVEYYYDRLSNNNETETFVVMTDGEEDVIHCQLAVKALKYLHKKVFLLEKIVDTEGKEELDFTKKALLDDIVENHAANGLVTILASGALIDQLAMKKEMRMRFERVTAAENDYQEDNIAVGRYGNYLTYISQIFKTLPSEINRELYKGPTCRFSVIIPCRNAGRTLYYTLKTCLNQSYKGKYEIIVSDNSDMSYGTETLAYRICQELNDSRIKYYRTPRNLYLAKSYEYAFLKAEGEFLFSLGADDGLLPWCLEELDGILKRYPLQNVFLWHEITYLWPDTNGDFVCKAAALKADSRYESGSPKVLPYLSQKVFLNSLYSYNEMYFLPQLYHNSGIRREYMAALYEKTGRLWGGHNQDISMALTIGNIEEKLYFIDNPLTITGVSNDSIGRQGAEATTDWRQKTVGEKLISTFACGFRASGYIERLCPSPPLGDFNSILYVCIMYAHAIGVIPDSVIENLDWKNIYEKSVTGINKSDALCDQKLHRLRYAVSLHGPELLDWFDNNFYYEKLKPVMPIKEKIPSNVTSGAPKPFISIQGEQMKIDDIDCINNVYKVSLYLKDKWSR